MLQVVVKSDFMSQFTKASVGKVSEDMFTFACTRIELLVIHEHDFNLFDLETVEAMKQAFLAKIAWRRERIASSKAERACARGGVSGALSIISFVSKCIYRIFSKSPIVVGCRAAGTSNSSSAGKPRSEGTIAG